MGILSVKKKCYKTALNYFQEAMIAFIPSLSNNIYQNPDIRSSISHPSILNALSLKAQTFKELFWNESKNIKDLRASLATYQSAIELINKIRMEYVNEASRLTLGEKFTHIFDKAIETSLQLYQVTGDTFYPSTAFDFVQQGKSALLALNWQESRAKRFSDIPDDLLKTEAALREQLAHVKIAIQKEMMHNEILDHNILSKNKEQDFTLTRQYEKLIGQFEKSYPQYYNLKYRIKTASIKDIQKFLDSQTSLIEYFMSDDKITLFVISTDRFDARSFSIDSTFFNLVESFRFSIRAENKKLFEESAFKLHQLLIAPVDDMIGLKENLIIIPHGILSTIPFEALLVHKPKKLASTTDQQQEMNYVDVDFLVKQFNLSYHFSATLYFDLMQTNSPISQGADGFIGFAPVFRDGRDGRKIARKNLFLARNAKSLVWQPILDWIKAH